jgi:hypothetical protein
MENLVKSLDTFGYESYFNFQSSQRFKTFRGGVYTLMSYFATLAVIGYYLSKLVARETPYLIYQTTKIGSKNIKYENEKINQGMFPAFFKLSLWDNTTENGLAVDMNKLSFYLTKYDLKAEQHIEKIEGKECSFQEFPLWTKINSDADKQIPLSFTKDRSAFNLSFNEHVFCIPTNKTDLSEFFNTDKYNIIIFAIYNETSVPYYLYLDLFYLYYNYDVSDYKHPVTPIMKYYGDVRVGQTEAYLTSFKFIETVINTDEGWINSEHNYNNFYSISDSLNIQQVPSGTEEGLFQFQYTRDDHIIYYSRSYDKIQDFLANIGGLLQVIKVFFNTFNLPFTQLAFRLDLINSVFFFEKDFLNKQDFKLKNKNSSKKILETGNNQMDKVNTKGISKEVTQGKRFIKMSKQSIKKMVEVQTENRINNNDEKFMESPKNSPEKIQGSTEVNYFIGGTGVTDNNFKNQKKQEIMQEIKYDPVSGKEVVMTYDINRTERLESNTEFLSENTKEKYPLQSKRSRNISTPNDPENYIRRQSTKKYKKFGFTLLEEFLVVYLSFLILKDSQLMKKKVIYENLWGNLSYQYLNIKEMLQNFITVDEVDTILVNKLQSRDKFVFENKKYSILDYLA